jgi:ParB-like chromosome segregation protein Spo0J
MDFPLHPITQDYADFTPQELATLRESLEANGQIVEVVIWNGQIVDGRHRAKLCRDLGLDIKYHDIGAMSEDQMRTVVRTLNEHRRARTMALTNAEKRDRIEAALKANPKLSDRKIADMLGVSHPTVAEVRKQLASTGNFTSSGKRVGKDGKSRTAPKPTPVPKPASPLDGVHQLITDAEAYHKNRGVVDEAKVVAHVVELATKEQLEAIIGSPRFGGAYKTAANARIESTSTPERSAAAGKQLSPDEASSAPPVTSAGVKSPTEILEIARRVRARETRSELIDLCDWVIAYAIPMVTASKVQVGAD